MELISWKPIKPSQKFCKRNFSISAFINGQQCVVNLLVVTNIETHHQFLELFSINCIVPIFLILLEELDSFLDYIEPSIVIYISEPLSCANPQDEFVERYFATTIIVDHKNASLSSIVFKS